MKLLKAACRIICIIIAVIIVIFSVNNRMNAKVDLTRYTFAHPEIPEAFDRYKIMLISDLHEAPFSDMIIRHIKIVKPDLIVFTGDMAQLPDYHIDETIEIVREFAGKIPMYAVSGNHETQNMAYWNIIDTLWSEGVVCLEDGSVYLEQGDEKILLAGIEDPEHDIVSDAQIEAICGQIQSELPKEPCFSVLLSHRADLYPEIKDTGVDLILSGHLHGGIVRLPFVGGVIGQEGSPFFPEYEYGYVKEGEYAAMIVSGGCDQNPKKKRFFNPPEVVLITLESEEA